MGKLRISTRLVLSLACLGLLLPTRVLSASPANPPAASFSPSVQDVVLSADRSLVGMVIDVDGRPRAGVNVLAESDGKAPRRVVTDSRGRFTLKRMRGGVYRITTPLGATLCRVWSPGTAPPTAIGQAILVEIPEVVRGQFYGPAGQLLANPWVLAAVLTSAITVIALAADRDSGS